MMRQERVRIGAVRSLLARAAAGTSLRALRGWLAALLLAGLIPLSAAAQQDPQGLADARTAIDGLNAGLLDTMKNAKTLGYAGRYQKLEPVLRGVYDFPAMAKAALGGDRGYWGQLTEEQQNTLVDAFSRMSISTYAYRFDDYKGQRFEMHGAVNGPRETVLVRTKIVGRTRSVRLNYLMLKRDAGWKIIDVFAKGSISEIATKRSDYGAVMKREGFETLISSINAKVAAHEKP